MTDQEKLAAGWVWRSVMVPEGSTQAPTLRLVPPVEQSHLFQGKPAQPNNRKCKPMFPNARER